MKLFKDHEKKLRQAYLKATPHQRLSVALQRIGFPECAPNRLIQIVSAVEGLARSLIMNARMRKGETAVAVYANVRRATATTLVRDALAFYIRPEAPIAFGLETWEMFDHAVNYRNLLFHECTFLCQGYSDRLIGAVSTVLDYLASIATTDDSTE